MSIKRRMSEIFLAGAVAAGPAGCDTEPAAVEATVNSPTPAERNRTNETRSQEEDASEAHTNRLIVDGIDVTDRYTNPDTIQILVDGVDVTERYTNNNDTAIIIDGVPREPSNTTRIMVDGVDVTSDFYGTTGIEDPNRTYVDDVTGETIRYTIED